MPLRYQFSTLYALPTAWSVAKSKSVGCSG